MKHIDATRDYTEKDKVAHQYRQLWANKFKHEIEAREEAEFNKALRIAMIAFGVAIGFGVIGVTLIIIFI